MTRFRRRAQRPALYIAVAAMTALLLIVGVAGLYR